MTAAPETAITKPQNKLGLCKQQLSTLALKYFRAHVIASYRSESSAAEVIIIIPIIVEYAHPLVKK